MRGLKLSTIWCSIFVQFVACVNNLSTSGLVISLGLTVGVSTKGPPQMRVFFFFNEKLEIKDSNVK